MFLGVYKGKKKKRKKRKEKRTKCFKVLNYLGGRVLLLKWVLEWCCIF